MRSGGGNGKKRYNRIMGKGISGGLCCNNGFKIMMVGGALMLDLIGD